MLLSSVKYSLTALDSDTLQSSVNSPITALVTEYDNPKSN